MRHWPTLRLATKGCRPPLTRSWRRQPPLASHRLRLRRLATGLTSSFHSSTIPAPGDTMLLRGIVLIGVVFFTGAGTFVPRRVQVVAPVDTVVMGDTLYGVVGVAWNQNGRVDDTAILDWTTSPTGVVK